MYDVVEAAIATGLYELVDMLHKIDVLWVEGRITDDEREKLIEHARASADPSASWAPVQEQLDALAKKVDELASRVLKLKGGEPETPEEWPEYVQPTGAHDAYHAGDKITYNGRHYVCLMDGCVWTPDAYPAGWREESAN